MKGGRSREEEERGREEEGRSRREEGIEGQSREEVRGRRKVVGG